MCFGTVKLGKFEVREKGEERKVKEGKIGLSRFRLLLLCGFWYGERGTNEERNKRGESNKGESETNRGLMAFRDQVVIKDQIGPF